LTSPDPEFEALLEFVRDKRGFDYTDYKRPTLVRRFQKRMDAVRARDYAAYREHLEREPEEFAGLLDAILINVTGFFRDPAAWEYVAAEIVPRILEQSEGVRPVRVWSAGCATGAEAYTLAMLFTEAIGQDELREHVKIYATDVDDDALRYARHAAYTEKEVKDVPEELRERYFENLNGGYSFRNGFRRAVIFGRNDLLQDPPISRVDLLVSRNTLMYFGQEAQDRILSNFFFALRPRGYLMLGKAEALHSRTSLFEPFDVTRRIFVKNNGMYVERRMARRAELLPPEGDSDALLRETAFEQARLAQIVVDLDGHVSAINHAARAMFGLSASDVTRPLHDLQISYKPLDLRSLIDQVEAEHRHVMSQDVIWDSPDGTSRHLDVQISPLIRQGGAHAGVSISFTDITRYRALQDDLERARRDLETAYEELQSTVEELETTNEELQSTNEELETTNEELQSTNEELETMNEELQSTNEELEAMNEEMRERTDEALHANAFLSSILSSVHQSIVVVDQELSVVAWSRSAAETWGLRPDEVRGEHLLNLDIGIAADQLRDPIRNVLAGDPQDELVMRGHNRRGQPVECAITFDPLVGPHDSVQGVILVMVVERVEPDD
jgi:two-component system, chemotaxis family, CheB/CheR fusion protein